MPNVANLGTPSYRQKYKISSNKLLSITMGHYKKRAVKGEITDVTPQIAEHYMVHLVGYNASIMPSFF